MSAHPYPWELLWELTRAEFRLRYGGSLLGVAWIALKPLVLFSVLYIIFSASLEGEGTAYGPLSLLIGVITYNTFSEGTRLGLRALDGKRDLLSKIPLPPYLPLLSSLATGAANYAAWVIVLLLTTAWSHGLTLVGILWFLSTTVSLLALTVICAILLALLQVRFRDTAEIWDIALLIVFVATPIFYTRTSLSPQAQTFLSWNPLTSIVEGARSALLDSLPSPASLSLVFGLVVLCLLSFLIFHHLSPLLADEY